MGIHNQSLGIFHSRTRSSGGPHPPWILGWGSEVSAGKINGTGNSKPEKDIASIPEDDWETNCRPGGNPGIRLGIAHHFVQLLVWGGARWVYLGGACVTWCGLAFCAARLKSTGRLKIPQKNRRPRKDPSANRKPNISLDGNTTGSAGSW